MQVVKDSSKIKIKTVINKGRSPFIYFNELCTFFIEFICLLKATSHIRVWRFADQAYYDDADKCTDKA